MDFVHIVTILTSSYVVGHSFVSCSTKIGDIKKNAELNRNVRYNKIFKSTRHRYFFFF